MAILINGNGNKAIWAAQDADLIAAICGNVTSIAAVGSQLSYTQEDANTIGVDDGVIITKEGRRIQLDSGNIDLFTIPTGVLGDTIYYICGYKLVQNDDSSQTCETFVQKMDNATDVITEDTFRGGATEVYVSLYRITQVGMTIDTVELLLPYMNTLINAGGSNGLPALNYSTPLHTFTSGNLSYTVTADEAYILGKMSGSTTNLSINGTIVAAGTNGYNGNAVNDNVSLIKVTKGDIVAVSGASAQLHVFGLKE